MGLVAHQAGATRNISTPPWMGYWSIAGLPRQYQFIHLGGERHHERKVSTTQRPWQGIEPEALAPESSTLTMRLPRLHHLTCLLKVDKMEKKLTLPFLNYKSLNL